MTVCLLALWLVATQHCGLETAGIIESHAAEGPVCCLGGEAHCSHDGCERVERGEYRSEGGAIKLASPQLAICHVLIWAWVAPPPAAESGQIFAPDFERTPEWVPAWQFERRAALSPRAPSTIHG